MEKQSKKKKRFYLCRWMLAAFLVISGFSMGHQVFTLWEQEQTLAVLEEQIAQQTAANDYLQKRIDNAHTESNIARLAREKLNMVWEGEILYEAAEQP